MHLKTLCLCPLGITETTLYDIKNMFGHSLRHRRTHSKRSEQTRMPEGPVVQPAIPRNRCVIEVGSSANRAGRDFIPAYRQQVHDRHCQQPFTGQVVPSLEKTS